MSANLQEVINKSVEVRVTVRRNYNGKITTCNNITLLECGPMPNVMVAVPNTGGALCSTPQSLADPHY